MLRKIASVVEGVVAFAALVTVVLLFTNDPAPASTPTGNQDAPVDAYGLPLGTTATPGATDGSVPVATGPTVDGAVIYDERCASCHGAAGGGGMGPAIGDGRTVAVYPDVSDQIAVVSGGRGAMPAFAGRLTDEEIAAVVDFVRNDLGDG